MKGVRRLKVHFIDSYDWEDDKDMEDMFRIQTALSIQEEDKKDDKCDGNFYLFARILYQKGIWQAQIHRNLPY